ncbi:SIR2 family protein [Caenispirillum bisanense]|uniref:SIR2-like domain-containing protein n=1 Tax=Caenispirillum bisanense TaxID=414052 RepID=A0A286GE98_9PROT|nr:SIR2 family protein [Caenispirillum bisanense]SOD93837.1 SIR2-like domain-containing protein [Caenispirillum bisanense]
MPLVDRALSQTIEAFADVLDRLLGGDPESTPPPVMTFWCGAGFSKAWDRHAPTDGELFVLQADELEDFPNLRQLLKAIGWGDHDHINFEGFKTLGYIIDMQIRHPEIRNRHVDAHNLKLSVNEIRTLIQRRFRAACEMATVDPETLRFPVRDDPDKRAILSFFDRLATSASRMGRAVPTPLFHFVTTNYDFTIETILDHIGGGPSVFGRLYRGVTPSRICGRTIWDHLPLTVDRNLIKVNGGFEILRSGDTYHFDYRDRRDEAVREEPPLLILPSRAQDYGDPYFHEIFPKAVRLLRETDVLVIVGYSMPREDALLRFILRQLAENPEDARGKHVFLIDTKPPDVIRERLEKVFFSIDRIGWPRTHYYPGRFEDFCRAAAGAGEYC